MRYNDSNFEIIDIPWYNTTIFYYFLNNIIFNVLMNNISNGYIGLNLIYLNESILIFICMFVLTSIMIRTVVGPLNGTHECHNNSNNL